MRALKRWTVEVFIGEDDGRTYAEARLHTEIGDRLAGVGRALLSPTDHDVPEIGDEVAVARALYDLSDHLLDTASRDIVSVTREDVHLSH
jgi:Domain of unknown function (DUF1876)